MMMMTMTMMMMVMIVVMRCYGNLCLFVSIPTYYHSLDKVSDYDNDANVVVVDDDNDGYVDMMTVICIVLSINYPCIHIMNRQWRYALKAYLYQLYILVIVVC